ncbi:MAG: metallophosphoesterase [Pseudomonadales bacterium]|nr:metallophosphoesterase [Pseudomonadales bacterium]
MANPIAQALRKKPFRTLSILSLVALFYYLIFFIPVLEFQDAIYSIPTILMILIAFSPLMGRLSVEYWHHPITENLARIAMTSLGVCFVYLCIRSVTLLAGLLLPQYPTAVMIQTSWILTALISTYGIINAMRLKVKEISLYSNKLNNNYRLVQISDVHIGSRHPAFLRPIAGEVAKLKPELLLITGDFVDLNGLTLEDLLSLQQIQCPIYFVIGNHERYIDLDAALNILSQAGFQILRNESCQWKELELIGIDDAESKAKVAKELPLIERNPELYQILMYHRPDGFTHAASVGIDLMLCGHTHNGQIIPFNFLVKRAFKRIVGLYSEGKSHLYVSPGTGTWGPIMRIGSHNEVTLINLYSKV